jgi:hypothetical protein
MFLEHLKGKEFGQFHPLCFLLRCPPLAGHTPGAQLSAWEKTASVGNVRTRHTSFHLLRAAKIGNCHCTGRLANLG